MLQKFKTFFYADIASFLLSAAALAYIPFLKVDLQGLEKKSIAVGALFWIGIVCGIVLLVLTVRCRKNIEGVLRTHKRSTLTKARPGVISFFQNPPAIAADVLMVLSAIALVLVLVFKVRQEWAVIASLEGLFLSFVLHCILNGINYKYIKAYKKYISTKEQVKK